MQELKSGRSINYLAAPLAGTGITASAIELYGLAAVHEDIEQASEAAAYAFTIMNSLGQRPRRDGTLIADDQEAKTHLKEQLKAFLTNKLPVWKQLGIV